MSDKPEFDALVVEITRGVTRFAMGIGMDEAGNKPVLGHYLKIQTSDFDNIICLLRHYIDQHGGMGAMPSVLALSHAGPRIGDRIIIPGSDLTFTLDEIRDAFAFTRIVNANDCVAMGSALPWLDPKDVASIAGQEQPVYAHRKGRYGLTVPTYGLGVASVIHTGKTVQVIDSEGGHANFAPCDRWQADFMMHYLDRGVRLTFDDVVSYPGLETLYSYIAAKAGSKTVDLRAQEILLYARNEADPHCLEAIHCFANALGAMAGDVALMLGAIDGMFLVSPFVNEVMDIGDDIAAIIRRRFEDKVNFELYMQRIPLYTITHRRVSMIGVLRIACEHIELAE
ncbi:glucokinase [Aquisalinus flavus]|uniref:Glucokinase n=1 Tax=Aquisalinus flavus TaxID=1526572 RepID=A0A8J2V4X8_9PROT|nr:glucokinase [Aquisalinus flavus]MBD0425660.1 glucokinase [Aquisalinus flavus]UNE48725.1 hypothetical protein FF099_12020 [Aquisalinus flavus]GGD14259.1 hypothetical protein GCM10011342_23820 [Aquisalinus flavus]